LEESIEIHGRAEGVYYRAGRRRHAGCLDLPERGDQQRTLLQLDEEVYRAAAKRDEEADATRRREQSAEEDRCRPESGLRNGKRVDAIGSRERANEHDPAKDLMPDRMRELVCGMCGDWAVSIQMACGAIGFDRSTFHYKSRRTDQAAVAKRSKDIRETRVRYGYRRVQMLLDREGWGINIKKVYRIYSELGMQLRNKVPKRRMKAKLRDDRTKASGPNDVWAMDFVHDQLATDKELRVLTSLIPSRATCRFWMRSSATEAKMWLLRRIGSVGNRAIPRRSASTKASSSFLAIWASEPTSAASRWTSPGPASPRIMRSLIRSIVDSARNA
jgi:putative transposase